MLVKYISITRERPKDLNLKFKFRFKLNFSSGGSGVPRGDFLTGGILYETSSGNH